MNSRITLWIIVLILLLSIFANVPTLKGTISLFNNKFNFSQITGRFPLKLGLDLQGGTQLVLETKMEKIDSQSRDQALESAREVIERRVNLFGVSEALVQTSKVGDSRRILVELPGVKDASEAANLVGRTAQLEFREMPATFSAEASQSAILQIFEYKPTGLTGADLKKAQVTFNATGGTETGPQVAIEFTGEGAKKFQEITKRNVSKPLAIFLDEQPLSFNPPIVQQEIIGGNAVISGNFSLDEAKKLAIQLNAGALPVPIKIIEQRSIGASLGEESIEKSMIAAVIGLVTIMLYMVFYYGVFGVIADLALIIYTLIVLAIFRTGLFLIPPVTLTLAGVAGFILSVGMAVDANILIFERMKEERRWGKNKIQALELGFRRAWSSIRDSNMSSIITAIILLFLGTGPVRGFAITLLIGVLVSMFTAIAVTKTFLKLLLKGK